MDQPLDGRTTSGTATGDSAARSRRAAARLPELLRRAPGTAAFLLLLLVTHVVVFRLPSADAEHHVLSAISTNLAAMTGEPWSAPLRLIGSGLVVNPSGAIIDIVLIVGVGVAVCLGLLEHRFGTGRAFLVFTTVHVLVSLVVLAVVAVATSTGHYPGEVRHELDYGVSFGALGTVGAATWLLPRWVRIPWAAVALFYPLTAATWYGWLPDYSTVGHVLSAATGLVIGALLTTREAAQARRSRG